jgi:hypothetical protein
MQAVMDAGELLLPLVGSNLQVVGSPPTGVRSVVPDRGIPHELQPPHELFVGRVARVVDQSSTRRLVRGRPRSSSVVLASGRPAPTFTHTDRLPKHLLIDDGPIVGVIDWELRRLGGRQRSTSPAARRPPTTLCTTAATCCACGYLRVTDRDSADASWEPAFAIDWALEQLGSENPAPGAVAPLRGRGRPLRRCLTKLSSARQGPRGSGNASESRDCTCRKRFGSKLALTATLAVRLP